MGTDTVFSAESTRSAPVSLEEKSIEAERRSTKEKERRRRTQEQQQPRQEEETFGLGIDVLAADDHENDADTSLDVGDSSFESLASSAGGVSTTSSARAGPEGMLSFTPVTPSTSFHRRRSIIKEDAPPSTGYSSSSSSAPSARAWVSPGGTMKLVQFTMPRSPMHLAGAGAEDSPALASTSGVFSSGSGSGNSSKNSVQKQRRSSARLQALGSSSPMVESIVSNRVANRASVNASPMTERSVNEKGMDIPPNDSGVFFDQLSAEQEVKKALRAGSTVVAFPSSSSADQQQPSEGHRRPRLDSMDSVASEDDVGDVSEAQSSAFLLQEEMGKMSFLDRVMQHKTSPVRLRKEAKAKERAERQIQEVSRSLCPV